MAAYRLVWFQHLHKAAGTYVIRRAMANGEILYPKHENGNPCNEEGVIPLWEMDSNQLTDFIDNCEKKGVTFVATEWGGPDFSTLAKDPRVSLLTCLRDPINRLVSNYNYDHYWMWTNSSNYTQYINEGNLYSSPEYYTRIFSRNHDLAKKIETSDLELAKKNITLFDNIIIAETGMDALDDLGWNKESDTTHPTFGSKVRAFHLLRKFRLKRLINYLRKVKHMPPEDLAIHDKNKLDISLYNSLKN